MEILFNWNIKEKPEDFIVKEVAEYPFSKNGKYFLYLLIKRNMNTKEITAPYRLWYAGLKDKNALTFQYVSSDKYLGELIKERRDKETFFIMYFLGRIKKRVKIGHLKGNKFSIKLKGNSIELKDWFINYYDLQRIERNLNKGKKLLLTLSENKIWKKLKWLENFYIEAYLSYIWNKSLELYLIENFEGYFIKEKKFKFFIPYTDYSYLFQNIQKFWPILGYKVKLNDTEKLFYRKVLTEEGLDFDFLIEKLKSLKLKGDYRKTFLKAEDIKVNKERIEFFLPKGAYATMYLKHIYSNS